MSVVIDGTAGITASSLELSTGQTFFNGTSTVPLVTTDGLINIENGQLKFWPDLDGDGDYDADMWANSNMYLAASSRFHIRSNIPETGGAGTNEGRLVIGATDDTNYIQSAKNFSGTVLKDFAIGEYNSTAWWAYFDQSAGGFMGVGTSAPAARLHVSDTATTVTVIESTGSATSRIGFRGTSQSDNITATIGIDTSGRLVGRGLSTDIFKLGATGMQAAADNTLTMGTSSFRWSVVYAGTGTINTSDSREKQDVCELNEAERRVAVAVKGLIRKYKWKDAVTLKGSSARWHFGVMAQDVIEAFEAEGLNAFEYGAVCYDEFPEEHDDKGDVIKPAGNRYGVRYDELFAFVLSAL